MIKYIIFIFALLNIGCEKQESMVPFCTSGDCNAALILNYPQDENGYYIVDLDFNEAIQLGSWPTFDVFIEADDINPQHRFYDGNRIVEAVFDSDTFWTNSNLIFTIPSYVPFTDRSTYNDKPITAGYKKVKISDFQAETICVAGEGKHMLKEKCEGNIKHKKGKLYTKREVGGIPVTYINDTISIYSKVVWVGDKKIELQSDLSAKVIIKNK